MSDQNDNLNHATFREQIAIALAGGLTAAEQAAFDAHAAACAACAAELQSAKEMEQHMTGLFAASHPIAGFEDRIISRLRLGADRWRFARPNWIHPAIQKAATGVAAAVVLAGFGYAGSQLIDRDQAQPARVASNFRSSNGRMANYVSDGNGNAPHDLPTTKADVGELKNRARSLIRDSKYNEALGAVDQILAADPRNEYALGIRPLVQDKSVLEQQRMYRKDVSHRFASALNQGEEKKIPYDDVLRYPANWPDISQLRNEGKVASEAGSSGKLSYGVLNPVSGTSSLGTSFQFGDQKSDAGYTVSGGTLNVNGAINAPAPAPVQLNAQNTFGGKTINDAIQLPADHDSDGVKSTSSYYAGVQVEADHEAKLDDRKSDSQALYTDGHVDNTKTGWFKPTELALVRQKAEEQLVQDQSGVAPGAKTEPVAPALQPAPVKGETTPHLIAKADAQAGKPAGQTPTETPPQSPPAPPAQPATNQNFQRKVVRNGTLEFEVDRFDGAFAQVSKLTTEAGGYVGTTDSEKLPNGKVKGTVTVRVPPDRLDTLVLQLRGIGELKSQKLEAQDVSKHYADMDSELRAARAMEERLLAIIKEGKGQIKDLLAAEKELGTWRTKIEALVGEMKYYDNLVSLSTLNITLYEKDIKTPATAFETETMDAGVESEDVEKARAEALKAIEEAKGRVIQSDLKRYDAGQFGATIVAEVPPDAAGPLLDRIKQIGKVARLDVQRKQTTAENAGATSGGGTGAAPIRVEKRDTHLNLSLYNLANVAPRQTTTLNIAAEDVETAYRAIIARVTKAGGRIVTSNLARNKPEATTGTISFEVPTAESDTVANDVRAAGDTMKMSISENPDVQNVTTAKRGYSVNLASIAQVPPREMQTMQVAAVDVKVAREAILKAAGDAKARVLQSQLNENDQQNVTATIDLDAKVTAMPAIEKVLASAGQTISRVVAQSTDTENTLESKVRIQLTLGPAAKLPPREVTTMSVELSDVEGAMADLQDAADKAGGRAIDSNLSKDREGRSTAHVVVDVPLGRGAEIVGRARGLGAVRAIDSGKNLQIPVGDLSRARIDITFGNAEAIVSPDNGLFASIRQGLSTSMLGLMYSLRLIIVGICFVLPWALIVYGLWRWMKRRKNQPTPAA